MTLLRLEEAAANIRLKELTIATVAALGVFFGAATVFAPSGSGSSPADPAASGAALAKSDFLKPGLPESCDGQAWGNWSADCVSAMTNGATTRNIRSVTFEERDPLNRTSTLVRVAAR